MQRRKQHAWNNPLLMAGLGIYGALLLLFGWQTWQFVSWLFPTDQLLAKILTMLSFDVLAAFWALAHTFYRFASRGAKAWVVVSWALTFILSLVASVLYLVVQFYYRFNIGVSPGMVNTGYAVSIISLVFNILALMSWLILEYRARHPRQDEFDLYEQQEEQPEQLTQEEMQRRYAWIVANVPMIGHTPAGNKNVPSSETGPLPLTVKPTNGSKKP